MRRQYRVAIAFTIASVLFIGILLLSFAHQLPALAKVETAKANAIGIAPPSRAQSPEAANALSVQPQASAPAVSRELYVAKAGESLPGLVHRLLPKTKYMTGSELERALREANPEIKGLWLKASQTIRIPGLLPADFRETSRTVPRDFEVRAIYLTGTMAGSAKGLNIIRRWRELGGNAVVFDIKDSDGLVNVPFAHPLSNNKYQPIRNLPKLVNFLHSLNLHAIARIAIFRDEYLVEHHPELAVQSRRTASAWRENGKLVWTDPSNAKVQEYNIALAKFAAESGVDEVQFDYVRFPAEGDQKDAKFAFETAHPQWTRADVITAFLADAHAALRPTNVLFSLDVFGVMAWQRPVDLAHTGQDIAAMAKHCDVMSPMIYPSHFYGMDGYKLPGDAPEHFIGASMKRFQLITKDTGVVLRPWLQAFGWRTPSYSPAYIRTQVAVAKQNGGIGFLFWNANNDYSKPYAAMPEMRSAAGKYMRGDEVGQPIAGEAKAEAAVSSKGEH